MTLASWITCSRIFLIGPIIYFSFLAGSYSYLALFFFLIAGLTDFIDGYVARKTGTETELGALLDLLADKLLVSIILIWTLYLDSRLVIVIPILLIVSRELIVSSVRQFIIEKSLIDTLKVSNFGKAKTTLQFFSISLLLINSEMPKAMDIICLSSLWLAAVISYYSLFNYLISWKRDVQDQ